jgi:hypothetical protein
MKDTTKIYSISASEHTAAMKEFVIGSWQPVEGEAIYVALEHPNWAPWLEASAATLAGRARVFPHGQLVIKDLAGQYAASLSMNQILWDGQIAHLPSWDAVAGDPTDYSKTHNVMGNALVMMSVNVAPACKGKHMPTNLIAYAKVVANGLGMEHLLGSFRPSGFGQAKKAHGHDLNFGAYCWSKQEGTGKPIDPWLRSLAWNGLELLAVDPAAMTVKVSIGEFEEYKAQYKPDAWIEVAEGKWECEEVGTWNIDSNNGIAVYVESNVWGKIPLY